MTYDCDEEKEMIVAETETFSISNLLQPKGQPLWRRLHSFLQGNDLPTNSDSRKGCNHPTPQPQRPVDVDVTAEHSYRYAESEYRSRKAELRIRSPHAT